MARMERETEGMTFRVSFLCLQDPSGRLSGSRRWSRSVELNRDEGLLCAWSIGVVWVGDRRKIETLGQRHWCPGGEGGRVSV